MLRFAFVTWLGFAACGRSPATPDSLSPADVATDVTGDGAYVPAPHRAWPQVPPRGGVVLSAMRLVWITTPDDAAGRTYYAPLFAELAAPGNTWWNAVAGEYDVAPPREVIAVQGVTALTGTTELSLTQLRAYVASAIASDSSLTPDGTTLYVLLLPEKVGAGSPCSAGGSHTKYGSLGDGWAHITRCSATTGTYTTTHEIIEGATDPSGNGYEIAFDASTAWTSSVFAATDGELADLCETMGSYFASDVKYQRSWSNAAAATGGAPCVPAATTPFFAASVDEDWYPISPGGSIDIPITGFATAAIGNWEITASVKPRPGPGSGAGYAVSVPTPSLGNGGSATLTVTADSTVAPGSWALVTLLSDGSSLGIPESYGVPIGVYVAATH